MAHDGTDNPNDNTPTPANESVDVTAPQAAPAPATDAAPRKILTPSSETKPAPEKKGKKQRPEPTTVGGKIWHNWVAPIGSVVIVVVLLRSSFIDWNDVPTGSMEPEIQVGDRIAVNRLAYGFQFPLTGPTIGIPFTPLQWDNPLDGIPQIAWGQPDRGDIVTFWNPVTDVRMVKRIVAVPGDTIQMQGSVLTINGTAAEYTPLTTGRRTHYQQPNAVGGTTTVTKPLEDQDETLLGETRLIQHIRERWLDDAHFIELGDGERTLVRGGQILRFDSQTRRQIEMPLQVYLQQNPQPMRIFGHFREGAITIDGQPASYNDLATAMFERFSEGDWAEAIGRAGLAVNGPELLVQGQAVPFDIFENHLRERVAVTRGEDQLVLYRMQQTLNLLSAAMMTNFGPITLGDDEYFMVGDNRNNSHDSRRFGPVQRSEITGEAFAVAFSFTDNKMFALPPDPAWERWFKDLD